MAGRGTPEAALQDDKVLALARIYLAVLCLSLLGSGSVVVVSIFRRRCCHDQVCQLRPLFLLSLADLLGALTLISTAAIQLVPAHLFILVYEACPYVLMLGMMFYAISLLMVLVYAYEMNQTVRGWRAAPFSTLQESSRCSERLQQALPSILAWLLPFLVFVVLLVLRGTSLRDVVPRPLPPIGPQASNRSQGASGLYCSSCLILIHHAQDICYQYTGRKDSGKESKVFFLMFVSLVLAGCTVLYCRVRGQCRRQSGGANHQPTLENCSCASRSCIACYFQLVFVVCWMPAFLLCILSFTSLQPASLFPLYMAVALTISLQGLLHSLVYGWLRQNFRLEVTGEQMSLMGHPDLKAFYEDSLAVASGD